MATIPQLSVVMSVYNGRPHLRQALASVLTQTFTDLEVIIVDDGSSDGSLAVLREFAKSDPRVRVITRENRGLAASLNEAVSLARGQWIARMDADDLALPHRFERQLAWLQERGDDLCGASVALFGHLRPRTRHYPIDHAAVQTLLLFNSPFAHPTVVGRAAVFKAHPYDVSFSAAQDYDLWARMALEGVRMSNVPEVLLRYRCTDSQVSVKRMQVQAQMREDVAKRYWLSRFGKFPLSSIARLSTAEELHTLLDTISYARLGAEEQEAVASSIWKMALRSGDAGRDLILALRRSGLKMGLMQRLVLNLVLRGRIRLDAGHVGLLYRFR